MSAWVDYIRQTAPKLDREESVHYVYDARGPRPAPRPRCTASFGNFRLGTAL
jgi:hypothetical protein